MTTPPDDHSEAWYSRDELIAELGLDPDYAARMWSAFGFANRQTDEKVFTRKDLDAFRLYAEGARQLPEEAQIATARAIGHSMSRLADWQADQLLEFDRNPDVTWSLTDMAKAIGRVQRLVWRRHLMLALQREMAYDTADPGDWEVAVGFVDIVGYTSLSRRIDHHELEELLTAFEAQISDEVTEHGGQVVKTLGDGVLFINESPVAAAATALAIAARSGNPPLPELRTGVAFGPVLARLGDVFGEPVNLAARLCGSARPGTVLIDEHLATAIDQADADQFRVRPIPLLNVRGYRRLRASALSRQRHHADD